ncbi:MAG TPA: hypothetical protein VGZ03_00440 [Acidimicrobiales bacterium]|jgi:hypothetical protein|nr:hypothetical protein [Acidimicrobiales bacterium]
MIVNAIVATTLISATTPTGAVPRSSARMTHASHHKRTPARARRKLFGITPRMMAAATRVSRCEEGGNWHFAGTTFDGGIGWTPENWARFRKPTWPRFMHDAPPHMQANALFRFVRYFGIAMPDQNGTCAGY